MTTPLNGIRVLDLTNVLAGPFCSHQLAHLGADVIKIERPGSGDLARALGADPDLNATGMGVSFLAQNSGKRSLTLDLTHDKGKETLIRLVRGADVLVENFRPGVMARLGLSYENLKAHNPRLIYAAISGFGQTGPLSDRPAYDQIIQGLSGVMAITGDPMTAPTRVGFPIADTFGGLTAAFAIAAELAKPKDARGAFVDVSMLAATLSAMGWAVSNTLVAGREPEPIGNDNVTASPSGAFATATGPINIAANKQEQFEALCGVLGQPDLAKSPRYATRQARLDHRRALANHIETLLLEDTAETWVEKLNEVGVPAGEILSLGDVLEHPQTTGRDMIAQWADPPGVGRPIRLSRTGIQIDGKSPATRCPPPQLGADSDAVLSEAGFSGDEIAALRKDGVI